MAIFFTIVAIVIAVAYEFTNEPSKKHRDEKLISEARRTLGKMRAGKDGSRRHNRQAVKEAVRRNEVNDAKDRVKRYRAAKSKARKARSSRSGGSTEEWESLSSDSSSSSANTVSEPNPELDALMSRCMRMDELIQSRFEANELTAVRYRLVLDEVRLGMLSNLDRQRRLRASVSHLDRAAIDTELAADGDAGRGKILRERIALLDDVEERIERMRAANEQALHTLDRAIVVLTDLAAKDGRTNSGLQGSVADLETLVSRAHRTASGSGQMDDIEIETSSRSTKKKRKKMIKPGSS